MMEVSGAESFAIRSTLLPDLSADCISTIVSMLPFVDVTSLLLSGSSTLSSRIIRQVREIDVLLGTGNKLPLNAYNFPHLHSLSIKAKELEFGGYGNHINHEPYLVDNDVLVKPHNTLSKLVLHGYLAFTILLPSDTHGPLEELLPNLLSLNLASSAQLTARYFDHIPSTLTELSLSPGNSEIFALSIFNKLPRTMATLNLQHVFFEHENESLESISFPPALTSFTTSASLSLSIIADLPRTLQTLEFELATYGGTNMLKVSDLPPSLTSLVIPNVAWSMHPYYLLLDVPLSSYRLNTLILPDDVFYLITDENKNLNSNVKTLNGILPPTLTSFSGIKWLHGATDWYMTTPRLEFGELSESVFQNRFPSNLPPLRSLTLPKDINAHEVEVAIPSTITKLVAPVKDTPEWLRVIGKLTRLQDLELFVDTVLPSDGFWNLMKTRLVRLSATICHLQSLDDIQLGWTHLKSLEFVCRSIKPSTRIDLEIPDYSANRGSEQKIFQFPSTLTNLDLRVVASLDFISYSFSNLVHLQKIRFASSLDQEGFIPGALASLPLSVTSLTLFVRSELNPALLAALPRNLLFLSLLNDKVRLISEEHVKALPKTLLALSASLLRVDSSKHWTFGEHLPNLLVAPSNLGTPKAHLEVRRQERIAGTLN